MTTETRARRAARRLRRGAAALGVLVVLGAAVWPASEQPTPREEHQRVRVNFGMSRSTASGTQLLDACARQRSGAAQSASLIEGSDGTCAVRTTQTPADPSTKRPAILATTVLSDLVVCADSNEGRAGSAHLFPADQITATGSLVGTTGLKIVVQVDPQKPTHVQPGAYCGRIVMERASGYTSIDLLVMLDDRGRPRNLVKALGLLVVGSAIGLLIRLLNDPISALVPLSRRMRSLRRWLRHPAGVDPSEHRRLRDRLDDAQDAINDLDGPAAATIIGELETVRAAPAGQRSTVITQLVDQRDPEDEQRTFPALTLHPGRFSVLIDHYWPVAMTVVLAGAVGSGFYSQYLQPADFRGTFQEWCGLLIYGLAAQVTLTGITEALGKLSPGSTR